MTTLTSTIIARNKTLAVHAATLEAGRVANARLIKLIRPKVPMAVRGYTDHPLAKLVLANVVSLAVQQYQSTNAVANKVSDAMIASAYQEFVASFDIPGMLDELFSAKDVTSAIKAGLNDD